MKYRKKGVATGAETIDAVPFDGTNLAEVLDMWGIPAAPGRGTWDAYASQGSLFVPARVGGISASPGDWVTKGTDGIGALNRQTFNATYEKVG